MQDTISQTALVQFPLSIDLMTSSASLSELVRRLRQGDDTFANELFARFARRLIGLARTHLDRRMQQKVDPEDVVQSVYRSFFRRLDAEQIETPSWDSLWYLLTVMTLRKCAKQAEQMHAAKRDARREVSLQSDGDSGDSWKHVADREPTPEEAALLTELVDQTMRDFDPEDHAVVMMSLQGYNVREISASLKRADRSVRRLRERVRKRLEDMLAQSEND